MGIFGRRSNEYPQNANAAAAGHGMHQPPTAPGQNYPTGPMDNSAPGMGMGMGTGSGAGLGHDNHANANMGMNNAGPMAGTNATQMGTGPAPLVNATSHPSRSSGVGSGSGSRSSSESAATEREANKLARKGKMENTMGGLFCNSRMKRDGEMHRAQAEHLRMQASELSEAQRLEQEAGMRRQRAVGLGADPSHAMGSTGYGPGQGQTQGAGMGMGNGNGMGTNNNVNGSRF